MLFSDVKHTPNATSSSLAANLATAKELISAPFKTLGIADVTDFATRVGYLIVGTYAVAMVINLAEVYA